LTFDVSGYLNGKDAFIKALERRAEAWNEAPHMNAFRGKIRCKLSVSPKPVLDNIHIR
jgi:hypothetical protein